jgi:hypothetical protein
VLLPTLAGGVIKRRPLPLRLPGREVAVVLSPEDADAVLDATPDPFTPASKTKSVR